MGLSGIATSTLLHTIISIFLSFKLLAAPPELHSVEPLKGEGVSSFLDRYQLYDAPCQREFFYEINNLQEDAPLMPNGKYFLPVLIYQYDGTSIRSTLGIDSWKEALEIKKYNEYLLKANLRRSTIVDSKIIWVPLKYLSCVVPEVVNLKTTKLNRRNFSLPKDLVADDLPPPIDEDENKAVNRLISNKEVDKDGPRHFPIFGDTYAYTPLKSNNLQNKIFYIVAGHGGPDPGARGTAANGHILCEDEYAYDVSLRLVRKIIEHGGIAYMITRDPDDGIRDDEYLDCDKDEYTWGTTQMPWQQKKRLMQRSEVSNILFEKNLEKGLKEQILVCIHVDSRSKKQKTDLFFYHYPGSKEGKKLADAMHEAMKVKYNEYRPNRGYFGTVTGRDLHMLRESKANSVYVELGNIQNRNDQNRIILKSNRELLADWLFHGIMKFYKKEK